MADEAATPASGAPRLVADVGGNVTANTIVFALNGLIVRLFGVDDTKSSLILLLVCSVALTVVLKVRHPIGRSALFVNVAANILANSVVLFVPPVNAWVRAISIFVVWVVGFVVLILVALYAVLQSADVGNLRIALASTTGVAVTGTASDRSGEALMAAAVVLGVVLLVVVVVGVTVAVHRSARRP